MYYSDLDTIWREMQQIGSPYEIEQIEVRGAPTKVFRNAPATIRDLWGSTRNFGDATYIIYENERITYAQAHAAVDATANWLLARGLRKGDRVAIAMRNYPEWLIAYWACVSLGICVIGVNSWWTSNEIGYALEDSTPKAIFCDPERLDRIGAYLDSAPDTHLVIVRSDKPSTRGSSWAEVVETRGAMPETHIDPEDDACVFYTSGTAGVPKGAVMTHRNCVTNIYNIMFGGQAQAMAARLATGAPPPAPKQSVTLIPTPFFHVTGSNCLAYSVTLRGGAMVLMYKWDPTEALTLIERERISEVSGVPVMTREIINHPRLKDFDMTSLLSIAGGGAAFQQDLVEQVEMRLPVARPRTGYGMTETSGSISTISSDFLIDKPTSVGRILPTFDARFVDDDGNDVPDREPGELWVRGGAVIKGYLNQPGATAETITDGWLHTGDLARLDADGFLHIVGRKKDMVIRGGENVYCAEVENIIQQHSQVAECCVFGIPDDRLGEAVAAAIVPRPGQQLTDETIVAYCADRLARHKIPSRIWFLDLPIPRNATGKFMKRELPAMLLKRAE